MDLQQSKEIDIGEKQLLEMQKETINHAMNDYKNEMNQKLQVEKERSKELMIKLQDLGQELELKNKQIEDHISNNSQLLQKQTENDRYSKNKFNEVRDENDVLGIGEEDERKGRRIETEGKST